MKIAVILFNLGGPNSLTDVKPFLENLFYDPAIIDLPNPLRLFVAKLISTLRSKKSKEIYKKMGGKSPLLQKTQEQADALRKILHNIKEHEFSVHIAMRYWHPRAEESVDDLKKIKPDKIIFLPLYPHYSLTTTASSFLEFETLLSTKDKDKCRKIKSYQTHPLFIKAHVELLKNAFQSLQDLNNTTVLFSAHGIPEDLVLKKGDPYQKHVEESVDAICKFFPNLNYKLCYQSKVGPKKWLTPNTSDCIIEESQKNKEIVVVPIAFVSDHSETLVELDIDFKELALKHGAKNYVRVPSLNSHTLFIECLANIVHSTIND
jgi:ferrochelatase